MSYEQRLARDLRDYDRSRGVARTSRRAPIDLAARAGATLAIFLAFASLGVLQRWWYRAADAVNAPAPQEQPQLVDVQERLRGMSPDERRLYKEFVATFQAEIIANPALLDISKPVWSRPDAGSGWADRARSAAMAMWLLLISMAERATWAAVAAAVAVTSLAAVGAMGGRPALARRAVNAGLSGARGWLWALSLLCALIFAATGKDLWLYLPWPAWAAAVPMLAVLVCIDPGADTEQTLERALDALLAPAASFFLLWLASLLV